MTSFDEIEEYVENQCAGSNIEHYETIYVFRSIIFTFLDKFNKGYEFENDVKSLFENLKNKFKDYDVEDPLFENENVTSDIDGLVHECHYGYIEMLKARK